MSRLRYIIVEPHVAKNFSAGEDDNPPMDCRIRLTAVATSDAKPGDNVHWNTNAEPGVINFYPSATVPYDTTNNPPPWHDEANTPLGDDLTASVDVASHSMCIAIISAELGDSGTTSASVVLCSVDPKSSAIQKDPSKFPNIGLGDFTIDQVDGGLDNPPEQSFGFDNNVHEPTPGYYTVLLSTGAPADSDPLPSYRQLKAVTPFGTENDIVKFSVPYSELQTGTNSINNLVYFICDNYGRPFLSQIDSFSVGGHALAQPNPNNYPALEPIYQIEPNTQGKEYLNGKLLDSPNDPITDNDFDENKQLLYFAVPNYGYQDRDKIYVTFYFNGWYAASGEPHFGPPITTGPWPAARFTDGFGNTANKGDGVNFLKVSVPKSKVYDYGLQPHRDQAYGYLWVQYMVLTGDPGAGEKIPLWAGTAGIKDGITSKVLYSYPTFTHCIIDPPPSEFLAGNADRKQQHL